MKNFIDKNMDMIKIILSSLGIISIIRFGEALMKLEDSWAGILGIGVSILGYVFTVIFLFTATPRLIKEVKFRLKK